MAERTRPPGLGFVGGPPSPTPVPSILAPPAPAATRGPPPPAPTRMPPFVTPTPFRSQLPSPVPTRPNTSVIAEPPPPARGYGHAERSQEVQAHWTPSVGAFRGRRVQLGPQLRPVQLPPDAYVYGVAWTIDPGNPNRTMTWIQRGESTAFVGDQTGDVVALREAPGEEGSFDFLRAALD